MKNFAENLSRLEQLTADIKRSDISIEDALKDFEEGIKLAHGMEKEIDRIEGKIQQLMNNPEPEKNIPPEMELFSLSEGSSKSPINGTRK